MGFSVRSFEMMVLRGARAVAAVGALGALGVLGSCGDPGAPVGTAWDEIHTVCGTNTMIRGIDVSVYQGTIDWPAAARGGVRFAYMRLANNLTLDTTFVRNWSGSRGAGVLRGAYQYFNPHSDAVAQANFVADTLLRNGFGPGDLPPMIDVEYPQSMTNPLPSRAAYATAVRRWLETIRARLGVDGLIYTGGYYWDANLNTAEFASIGYWHAQYPNYPATIYQMNVTPLPLGGCPTSVSNHWSRWVFWQFAGENGRAPGVTGAVDCDAFNGTMDELRRLARLPPLDGGSPADAGRDGSAIDAAREAGAPRDGGAIDAARDIEMIRDGAGSGTDANPTDANETDANEMDAGATDAGATDAGATDAGATDAGATDARGSDGGLGEMPGGCACRAGGDPGRTGPWGLGWIALVAAAQGSRRRRPARD